MSVIILALASVLGGPPPHKWPARFYIGVDRYGTRVTHGMTCREVRHDKRVRTTYVYERRAIEACR